jgi:hypothetical protein
VKNSKHILVVVAASAVLFSCATSKDLYKPVDEAVAVGNFTSALAEIDKAQTPPKGKNKPEKPVYPAKDKVLLYLDKGMLEHYAADYGASSKDLQEGESLIQEAFTKSITKEIGTFIANDNTRDYGGEDYEDIYINIFNSLNYYHKGDMDGAGVEVRRVTLKLNELSGKYTKDSPGAADMTAYVLAQASKLGIGAFNLELPDNAAQAVAFKDSALARYLSALYYRFDNAGGNDGLGNARNDLAALNAVFVASPNVYSNPIPASLVVTGMDSSAIAEELNIPKGKARLNVICFTGLAPVKREKIEDMNLIFYPVIGSLLPIDMASGFKSRITLGNLALPVLDPRPSVVNAVEVEVDGQTYKLDLLEDMGKVMSETFLARYNQVFVKTYIRAAIKYAAVEVAGNVAIENDLPEFVVQLAVLAAKKGTDASEHADIRSTRYFPAKAYVGGITLDPGAYTVMVKFSNGETRIFENLVVKANALNLVEAVTLR